MRKKRVLCVCGAGVATSVVLSESVKRIAREASIPLEITTATVSQLHGRLTSFKPDLIVASAEVPRDVTVPTVRAISFLTGVDRQKDEEKIIEILSREE